MKYLEYFAKNLFPKIYPRLMSFMMNAITKKLTSNFENKNNIMIPETVPANKESRINVDCN